ncbi:MAG: hypothetical protein V8R85_00990, partial [Frisingicoccus sp.]
MQNIVDEEYRDDSNFGYNNALGLEWRCSVLEEDGSTSNYDQMTMQYWYWENENAGFRLIYNNADEAWAILITIKKPWALPKKTPLPKPLNSLML